MCVNNCPNAGRLSLNKKNELNLDFSDEGGAYEFAITLSLLDDAPAPSSPRQLSGLSKDFVKKSEKVRILDVVYDM